MATVIKIKRGTATPTTSDIVSGEVAIDTSAQKFYINDSGTVKEIGGGSGGSSLTVADEGSNLSTAATTLNFVGAGVTASGGGVEKTINIPGGATAMLDVTANGSSAYRFESHYGTEDNPILYTRQGQTIAFNFG